MRQWIVPPNGEIEPAPAPEFYIDDIGPIELFGANVRLHCYSEQLPLECAAGFPPQRVVVVKIVRPLRSVAPSIGKLAQCLWQPPPLGGVKPPAGFCPRLVR